MDAKPCGARRDQVLTAASAQPQATASGELIIVVTGLADRDEANA